MFGYIFLFVPTKRTFWYQPRRRDANGALVIGVIAREAVVFSTRSGTVIWVQQTSAKSLGRAHFALDDR
jgi:hypothetical protein